MGFAKSKHYDGFAGEIAALKRAKQHAVDVVERVIAPAREPFRGLEKVCKLYGRVTCGDVMIAWDYANDCAVPEEVLRADLTRWAASERARYS